MGKQLPIHLQTIVDSLPETGMGYHIADVELTNGTILQNRIILNSVFLQLTRDEVDFDMMDIKSIKPIAKKSES